MANYYKIIDDEKGYSKFIRETEERTLIVSFGSLVPTIEVYSERYKKQPDEVVLPCPRREYLDKHYECMIAKENIYEPILI